MVFYAKQLYLLFKALCIKALSYHSYDYKTQIVPGQRFGRLMSLGPSPKF